MSTSTSPAEASFASYDRKRFGESRTFLRGKIIIIIIIIIIIQTIRARARVNC